MGLIISRVLWRRRGLYQPSDPSGDISSGFGAGLVVAPVEEFFLQGGEERFGRGVVQGAAGLSHGLGDAEAVADLAEGPGAVLRAAVGVENHPGDVAAADRRRHADRIAGELGGGSGVAEREPHEAPAVEVHHRREVHGALIGEDLFEIPAPLLVRRAGSGSRVRSDPPASPRPPPGASTPCVCAVWGAL